MEKTINLEESPFIDLRKNKNATFMTVGSQNHFQNLPQDEDKIEYKIHKDFIKVNLNDFAVSNKEDQTIISKIIEAIRLQYRLGISIENSHKFISLVQQNEDLVLKYLKEDNPQCVLIALRYQCYDQRFQIAFKSMTDIADKSKYPLLMIQVYGVVAGMMLGRKQFEKEDYTIKKGFQFIQYGLKCGYPQAFIWKGMQYTKLGLRKNAYEMFKNGQLLGNQPTAYKYIGQLFMGGITYDISRNLRLADKYFKKAKQSGAQIQQKIQIYMQQQLIN